MATISEALAIAIQHHQAGRLQAAEQIYRQILQAEPNQPDAWHLLGVIAHQVGNHKIAVEYIERAIGLQGNAAPFHYNLGRALQDQGKLEEAVTCYGRALQLKPDFAAAHNNLGNALKEQRKLDEAAAAFRRALELKPDLPGTHYNLGNLLKDQRKLDEAVACYRLALELKPDFAEAGNDLGVALQEQGKLEEAVASFRRALELKPDWGQVQFNLANALWDGGHLDEAVVAFRRTLELMPDDAAVHFHLGDALSGIGNLTEAVACYQRALQRKPDHIRACLNLALVLKRLGHLEEATAIYRQALAFSPDSAELYNNFGRLLADQGAVDEALDCFHRALELQPQRELLFTNYLWIMQYRSGVSLAALAEAHAEYDRRHAVPLRGTWQAHVRIRDTGRPLRLGFVSPYFWKNSAGRLLVRPLESLRHHSCEFFCYSDSPVHDDFTDRMAAAVYTWRDIHAVDDEAAAAQIQADDIDILFDVSGAVEGHRLLLFARKPAPIQIAWMAREGTTGLEAMDCLLADGYVVPTGAEPYYREQVLRLPDGYVCFEPLPEVPSPGPLPAQGRGEVTFASFSKPSKVTLEVVAVWAAILRRLPAARLLLKNYNFGMPMVQRRYLELFRAEGVEPSRIEFAGHSPLTEALAEYRRVDIALDTFPFSGSLTTCDAMWMGVPVITCPFETFASRHSLSHLSNVGLTEMIAHDLDEYVELAVSLAGDLPRLGELRARLRQRMAASPLCDGKRFAANLVSLLHDAWQQSMG